MSTIGENGTSRRVMLEQGNYRRERLLSGIVVLRLLDDEPETLEAWFEDCNRLMGEWEPGQRLRYLHDIRGAERVTPRATDRVARILKRMRNTPVTDGRGAIVLKNSTIASLLGTFFKRRPQANWTIRFFDDEADALRWLSQ